MHEIVASSYFMNTVEFPVYNNFLTQEEALKQSYAHIGLFVGRLRSSYNSVNSKRHSHKNVTIVGDANNTCDATLYFNAALIVPTMLRIKASLTRHVLVSSNTICWEMRAMRRM